MIAKLSTGVLLVATLLLHVPAQGQITQKASDRKHSASVSTASFETGSLSRLDLPGEIAAEARVRRGFSASRLASAMINVLVSQNTIALYGLPSSPMDAYLRPPDTERDDSGLFLEAKSIYDDATTIHYERAEVTLDPLKMQCILRINLNRLLSNGPFRRR